MLSRLTKLAQRSAQLRELSLRKEAGLLGAAAKTVGGIAAKNPGFTTGAAMSVGFAGLETASQTKKNNQGFDPSRQQALQGPAPKPPGA